MGAQSLRSKRSGCTLSQCLLGVDARRSRQAAGPLHAVLMSRVGEVRDWQVDAGDGPLTYQPQPVMRLSSILMLHQTVHAGRGAAILPWSLVAGDVASGRLSTPSSV